MYIYIYIYLFIFIYLLLIIHVDHVYYRLKGYLKMVSCETRFYRLSLSPLDTHANHVYKLQPYLLSSSFYSPFLSSLISLINSPLPFVFSATLFRFSLSLSLKQNFIYDFCLLLILLNFLYIVF